MSTPNEIRIQKNRQAWRGHGWTATPNALLLRSDISWEAKGAFGWMSLAADDPEFEVTARSLAAAGPKGRDHAEGLVRELERHGYLTRQRIPEPDGTPVVHYELHPFPVDGEHNTYVPSTAKKRDRSKSASSQRSSQSLTRQGLGDDQETVDNSKQSPPASEEAPGQGHDVVPAQFPIPDAPGTGASGTDAPGTLTSSSRKTSSSLGSSTSTVEVVSEHQEEEEAEEGGTHQEVTEDQQRARTLLGEYARFRPGKYLGEQARATCEALLAEHLAAGWDTARLGRYLRDWSAQAHNPSTWLPHQLRELGAPLTPNRTHSENQQHQTGQQAQPASDEARAAARAAFPLKQPTAPPQPRWKQRLQAERSDSREPEQAFADLEELLGQNPEPPQTN